MPRLLRLPMVGAISLILLTFGQSTPLRAHSGATDADMGIQFEVHRVADLETTPIDFGAILINGGGGRVNLDRHGAVTFSGGVVQVSGFPQAGTLTMDADGVVATVTLDPSVDMGDGLRFSPSASRTRVHLTGEPETVYIYGVIELPPGTRTNDYRGVLHINVTYD